MLKNINKALDIFKPKCPKCGSSDLKIVKESIFKQSRRLSVNILFPILFLFNKKSKDLIICRSCGFSHEAR